MSLTVNSLAPQLLPVTGQQLREVARASKNKAGGPDGLSPGVLAALPAVALERLAALLNACEERSLSDEHETLAHRFHS